MKILLLVPAEEQAQSSFIRQTPRRCHRAAWPCAPCGV